MEPIVWMGLMFGSLLCMYGIALKYYFKSNKVSQTITIIEKQKQNQIK